MLRHLFPSSHGSAPEDRVESLSLDRRDDLPKWGVAGMSVRTPGFTNRITVPLSHTSANPRTDARGLLLAALAAAVAAPSCCGPSACTEARFAPPKSVATRLGESVFTSIRLGRPSAGPMAPAPPSRDASRLQSPDSLEEKNETEENQFPPQPGDRMSPGIWCDCSGHRSVLARGPESVSTRHMFETQRGKRLHGGRFLPLLLLLVVGEVLARSGTVILT